VSRRRMARVIFFRRSVGSSFWPAYTSRSCCSAREQFRKFSGGHMVAQTKWKNVRKGARVGALKCTLVA
jgi:hypothetical protein